MENEYNDLQNEIQDSFHKNISDNLFYNDELKKNQLELLFLEGVV